MPDSKEGQKPIKLISDRDIGLKAMRIFGMDTEEPALPETLKFLGNKKVNPANTPFAGSNEPML
jgi:hypothetical protein